MTVLQIHVEWNGHPVQLRMGWDRPLQGFHLYFSLSDAQTKDPRFAPLLEANTALFGRFPSSVRPIVRQLEALGVTLAPAVLIELRDDAEKNRGNKAVLIDAQGVRRVIVSE